MIAAIGVPPYHGARSSRGVSSKPGNSVPAAHEHRKIRLIEMLARSRPILHYIFKKGVDRHEKNSACTRFFFDAGERPDRSSICAACIKFRGSRGEDVEIRHLSPEGRNLLQPDHPLHALSEHGGLHSGGWSCPVSLIANGTALLQAGKIQKPARSARPERACSKDDPNASITDDFQAAAEQGS